LNVQVNVLLLSEVVMEVVVVVAAAAVLVVVVVVLVVVMVAAVAVAVAVVGRWTIRSRRLEKSQPLHLQNDRSPMQMKHYDRSKYTELPAY
jgi:hypothetical protein